jgi:hypothetical protein
MKRERHEGVGPVRRAAAAVALRFHADQCGQAIYIVVMYMFLLLGLLVLVINSGEKVNHKIEMQGAADSAAMTGGAWYARGLNVVSMCDVGEVQLLSTIVLCDTLETVTTPAKECIDKLSGDVPIDIRLTDADASSANNHIFLVAGNAASEKQVIYQFDDIVQAISWPKYLNYNGGVLWDCMKLLDGFSHAMILDTPRAACREAVDVATKNHADFGFMTPFWPELPIEIGVFQDFKDPMRLGTLPARFLGRPGYDSRAALRIGGFNWGVMNYRCYGSTFLDDRNTLRHISGAKGPWSYWREPFVESRPMGLLDLSGFGVLFNIVSSMKFEMLFGSAEDQASLRKWDYGYDTAKGLSEGEIRRTWWESVGFDARYVEDEERKPFPPPTGEWTAKKWGINAPYLYPSTRTYPNPSPWPPDPRSNPWPSLTGYTRATQPYEGADPRRNVWYRVDRHRTPLYPELGIFAPHPPVRDDGSKWPYTDAEMKTYWHISMRRFNGAELAPDTALHRTYMPSLGEAPDIAPVFFTDQGVNLVENIEGPNGKFTFNGYAYRAAKATNWVQRFINPNPSEAVVCYAQSRVYNPASWDLFTQAWKVKLMRAQASYSDSYRWGEMLSELKKGIPSKAAQAVDDLDLDNNKQLDNKHVKPVLDTVSAHTPAFVQEVTH